MSKPAIHAESARVGIRLGLIAMQGKQPPEDVVGRILATGNQQMQFIEFPMDMIQTMAAHATERRRICAMKALEMLLVRSGDAALLTEGDLEKIVAKAWRIAGLFEREDMTAQTLDTLDKKA